MHIGDDDISDIQSAERAGISAYKIYSGLDLLEKRDIWDCRNLCRNYQIELKWVCSFHNY